MLAAAGLAPGDVIPGVVGYEWDSFIPGCFAGQVVPLMTTLIPGSNGVPHSADMVRATAPSGGRVFAMARWSWPGRSMTWTGAPPTRRWSRSAKQPSAI